MKYNALDILRANSVDAFKFGKVWINVDNCNGWIQTVWPDGKILEARWQDTPAYRAVAESLGYATDREGLQRMNAEHEALHTIACVMFGMDSSPTLRYHALNGAADLPDKFPEKWQRETEEQLILDVQRFLNGVQEPTQAVIDLAAIVGIKRLPALPGYLRRSLVEAKRAADRWIEHNAREAITK